MQIRKVVAAAAGALRSLTERALGVTALRAAYERVVAGLRDPGDVDAFLDGAMRELDLFTDLTDGELDRVPATGPLVVVANHPHGILDGLLLAALLRRVRPDLRVMGNRWLHRMPALEDLVVDVDPLGGRGAARTNTAPLRAAHRWLDGGGALLVFPSGKISARRWGRRGVHDDRWSPHVARLQRHGSAWVLPVHIGGRNSASFQLAGLVHPRLRTLLIARETLGKRCATVPVRIGNAIPPRQLTRFDDARELVDYLRLRSDILGRRSTRGTFARPAPKPAESIVPPVPDELVAADVAALPASQRLVASGSYEVHYAWGPQAPHLLREIGRLREQTFREVGEGTGRTLDLDRFDDHYLHLFVWHKERRHVVGAYRLGRVDKILANHDERGLYTHTLYDYDERFLRHVSPGIELGRSFVQKGYQREFLPLQLLWRGIATYVARHPQCCTLFGAVSISDRHDDVSKQLMVDHLRRYAHPEMSTLVSARHPLPAVRAEATPRWTDAMVADLGDVSAMVAEIETDQRGVPVLLREYLKLGGQLVGLNVDPRFQHTITALVVIDMRRTAHRMLRRYMGAEAAEQFLAWHRERSDRALGCA